MKLNYPLPFLSGNLLKIIAVLTMTFDHYSAIFHPGVSWMRIPGRIAFPIFAFLVAEGFRHTKNRLRYLLTMGAFASVSHMLLLWISRGSWTSILATFCASIGLCFLIEFVKKCAFDPSCKWWLRLLSPLSLVLAVLVLYYDKKLLNIFDYGFWGVMLAPFATVFHSPRGVECPKWWQALDILPVHLLTFAIPLVLMNNQYGGSQVWATLALVPLLLYSGKRGKLRLKYLVYIYYPSHILLLHLLAMLFGVIEKL